MYNEIRANEDLLIDVITKHGMNKQKQKAAEKLMGLGQELLRNIDNKPHNVEEKIAEVEIMLAQMRVVYNQPIIDGFIDAKLEMLKRKTRNI